MAKLSRRDYRQIMEKLEVHMEINEVKARQNLQYSSLPELLTVTRLGG